MTILVCAPVCVGLIGLAPRAARICFSAEFEATADILRWQVVGDIMKVMAWPLGFVLLARGDGRRYLVLESAAMIVLVATVWLLLPVSAWSQPDLPC